MQNDSEPSIRKFETGATRDTDQNKLDYDGFLCPLVLQAFAEYMHKNRLQKDGNLRASDNWQRGLPREVYRKSAWRHFVGWWKSHRNEEDIVDEACGILFNVMGDLHEFLKKKNASG